MSTPPVGPPVLEDPSCSQLRSTRTGQQATIDSLTGQLIMAQTGLVLNQRLARFEDPTNAPAGDFTAAFVQGRLDQLGTSPDNEELRTLYGQIRVQLAIIATVPGEITGANAALQGTLDQMKAKGCH